MGVGSARDGGISGPDSPGFNPWMAVGPSPARLPVVVWLGAGLVYDATQAFLRVFDGRPQPLPVISGFTPAGGTVGTEVTVTGTGLDTAVQVRFNGIPVTPTAVTATSLKAVVPSGATTGPISVTTAGGAGVSAASFRVRPRIDGFEPASVIAGSETVVSVFGANLRAGLGLPTVKVGAFTIPATFMVETSEIFVRFRAPAGTPSGRISVTTADGTATSAAELVVFQTPRPTGFTPAAAPVGATVTITGTNLVGATAVTFSGNVTAPATLVTATSLKVTVPDGARTGTVAVTNPAGPGTSTAVFRVPPRITGFSPSGAVAGSSTVVTITGTNLVAATGSPVVKIGALVVPASLVPTATATIVQFQVPSTVSTGRISVTTIDGTSTSATDLMVFKPPRPTGFVPATGRVGETITITGVNLIGATSVEFSGPVSVTATAVTATSLRATVPAGAQTGPVSVTTPAGTGASTIAFKVVPKILGFSPPSVVAGSGAVVTMTGLNLRAASGPTTIKIGAFTLPFATVLANTSTTIQFTVPLAAVTAKISVTTIDGTALSAVDLVVIKPPKITSFTPAAAPVGSIVTLNGTFLAGTTVVTFGGNASTAPTVVTAAQVKVVVPDGAVTGKLSVTNPADTGTSVGIFKVAPRITGFSPASAAANSSTVVTISGTNLSALTGTPIIKVGALVLTPAFVLSNSSTTIEIRVPFAAVTGKLSVTTIDGTAVSATNLLVIKPPKPTRIVPPAARVGDVVTINGTGFTGVTDVLFGFGPGVSAPFTVVSDTTLKVTVPAGVPSLNQVGVFNAAGAAPVPVFFGVLPTITGFSPASGAAGDLVTVTGNTLRSSVFVGGHPLVKVGPFPAIVVESSPAAVSFLIPSTASTARISVDNGGGAAVSATDLVVTTPRMPDLFVANIEMPAVSIRSSSTVSRTLSMATTVANLGPVPSPPSSVLLGLEPIFGSGPVRLLGRVAVPGVAPGSSAKVTVALVLPPDLATGDYQARGQVDPDGTVTELVETNNTEVVNVTTVVPSIAGSYPFRATVSLVCAALPFGDGDFTGTLPLTQSGASFSGTTLLAGKGGLAGLSMRVTLAGQIAVDGSVSSGTSFQLITAGTVRSSGPLGLMGSLTEDVLALTLSGIATAGDSCILQGEASASAPPSIKLGFVTAAQPGAFGAGTTVATLTGPLAPSGWSARLGVRFDADFPSAAAVQFTAPAGGGLSQAAAVNAVTSTHTAEYRSPQVTSPAFPPGGAWNVVYKGPRALSVPPPQGATRLVFPVPALGVSPDGFLRSVRWTYRNAANVSVAPPAFLRRVHVLLEDGDGATVFESQSQPPGLLPVPILADIPWSCVGRVVIAYVDDLGNRYEAGYPNLGLNCVPAGGRLSASCSSSMPAGSAAARRASSTYHRPWPTTLPPRTMRARRCRMRSSHGAGGLAAQRSALRESRAEAGGARYDTPWIPDIGAGASAHPPGGSYGLTDLDGNPLVDFVVPDPQAEVRSVLIVPSVTLGGGTLTQIDWTYRDTNGSVVGVQPYRRPSGSRSTASAVASSPASTRRWSHPRQRRTSCRPPSTGATSSSSGSPSWTTSATSTRRDGIRAFRPRR